MACRGLGSIDGGKPVAVPSYPSNCLYFAKELLKDHSLAPNQRSSCVTLNIIVVGAGLGGLATAIALAQAGHKVKVYEQTPVLGEVGAGIQIPSNSTRILFKLGLQPYLAPYVTEPESIHFRRWQNGKLIGKTKLVPNFGENFNAPYYVIHRADFHSALCRKARDEGIEIQLGAKVVDYDPVHGSIKLADSTEHSADLVVAADGIKSAARKIVLDGQEMPFRKPGFAVYRAVLDVNKMRDDPELSWILAKPALNIWIGDNRHAMTYTIGAGKAFNMVLSHPDLMGPSTWNEKTALEDMKAEFQGWDPVLEKIIGMVEKTIKWPLMSGSPLRRWAVGKLVVIGDAAHAMLPYMSQGAAMAVEDGIALARSLSHMESPEQWQHAVDIFQTVRIKRSSQMQEASLLNGQLWHFADGPLQKARDAAMIPEVEGLPFSHSPNQWSDPATQMWCYGYDSENAIDEAWVKAGTAHENSSML
ncbi:salicylate hydroxylase, putative [Talaromyces stipitatus ATCC 10500]|uniref:Salicylate hydroxylase, putative n=1 Tax=Talaromyces stipitatus (strain ATCC 10500 / CBS 375.48 / QM 6759 / NRRL 1006) TaxID=441959 RepID=B8MB87_TALSN|nr:salicylate hydroxylase, putative [Talaromyces stipitatus ATCC 10500]EED18876.1 salicylate hydroxylase, putative [Talaromyces stipitatus ATCC 10500]